MSLSIGKAIGLIKNHHGYGNLPPQNIELTPEDQDFLKSLKIKLEKLTTNHNIFELKTLSCKLESPFLKDNHDFLLTFFLTDKNEKLCPILLEHLNNCLNCSEIYAEILNDFHRINSQSND